MKSAPILLVAFGLLLLYVILSDKYVCFTEFLSCLTGQEFDSGATKATSLPNFDDSYNQGRQTGKSFCESIFGAGSWFCSTNILPGAIPQQGSGGSW